MARISSRVRHESRNGRSRHDFNGRLADQSGIVFSGDALILNMTDDARTWTLILDEDETARLAARLSGVTGMNEHLVTVSSLQREAMRRANDTMRKRHNEFVRAIAAMPVPPEPDAYMRYSDVGYCIRDALNYVNQIAEHFIDVLDGINDMVVDSATVAVKPEPASCIRDILHDWSGPLEAAADTMIERKS